MPSLNAYLCWTRHLVQLALLKEQADVFHILYSLQAAHNTVRYAHRRVIVEPITLRAHYIRS